MNEREALEKIDSIIVNAELANEVQTTLMICDIRKVLTQALAPQEPQEKTFTVDEIKENVSKIILKYHRKQSFNLIKDLKVDLLAEFEKEVNNEK